MITCSKHLGTAILILFFCYSSIAQECGNCKSIPKLATFDFDVKVPQPNVNDSTGNLWPEWKNLFIIAPSVGSHLRRNEGKCIVVVIPPSLDTGGFVGGSVGGETFTNLPSNPAISSDLSSYGDYLLTGEIRTSGGDYIIHAEIQSSCSRSVVATADVRFKLNNVVGNVSQLAGQVAAQFSPLGEKIKKFELEERNNNKALSLFKESWGAPIRVTPQKKTLKAGESTELTIELKDCDGTPLEGREIVFSETGYNGNTFPGTSGGSVTPAKLITDAQGMARARFTLKAGAKEAIIRAYSGGREVKGCISMFSGDAFINIKRTYSGFIKYSMDQVDVCEKRSQSGVTSNYSMWNSQFKVDYTASFYTNETGGDLSEDNEDAAGVPAVLGGGNMIMSKREYKNIKVQGNPPTEQLMIRNTAGGVKSSSFRFSFDITAFVEVNLNFLLQGSAFFKQTYLPTGSTPVNEEFLHSVAFFGHDPNVKYQKSTEGGKIKHTFTYLRVESHECTQIVERLQLQVFEE
jgi:hypothetical protein